MERVRVVKIETGEAQTSVKELRSQLKELRNTMLSVEEGTKEYNDALVQAANIQHTLKEQMEEVNASAMDFGQITGNVVKATGGIVAGFQAAQATMNLFGIENETVIKSLQKMQSLMAITQAIPAIDDGVKAFKRLGLAIKGATVGMSSLKKALISTGIGAAVVAVGALVANWDKVTGAMKRWGIIHQTTAEKLEEEKKKAEGLKQKLEEAQKAYKDWEKQTAINNLSSAAKEEYNELNNQIEGYKLRLDEIVAEQDNAGKARWEELKEEALLIHEQMRLAKNRQDEILADKSLTKEAAEADEAAEEARKKAEEDRKKRIEDEKKAVEELRKKYGELAEDIKLYDATDYEKDLASLDKAEKQSIKTIEDAQKKGIISKEQYEEDKLKIEKYYSKLRENAQKEEAQRQREESIASLDTTYQLEQAKLQKQYDEGLISEQAFIDGKKELLETYVQDYVNKIQTMLDTEKGLTDEQILDLTNKINDARAMLKPEETKPEETKSEGVSQAEAINAALNTTKSALQEVADNPAWGNIIGNIQQIVNVFDDLNKNHIEKGSKEAMNAYVQVAALGFGAVGQMLNGLAAEQKTTNKEGFETAKKMQIASATMTTLSSVLQAYAAGNSMASQMGLAAPVGWAMGAAMASMVGALGAVNIAKIAKQKFDEGSTTSSSAGATPNTGAINSVIAPVQYTQDVQGASIEGAIKDSRVFVVESDITNTQNKVSVTENEAKY